MTKIITIDGPSGSGKSSVANYIAKVLKFKHLNSGYIYRSLAYALLDKFGLPDGENTELDLDSKGLSEEINYFFDKLSFKFDKQNFQVYLDKKLINPFLDSVLINKVVPHISRLEDVRNRVKSIQRGLAQKYDLVAEGRDCGTEVFPDANVKIYFTASVEARAERVFSRVFVLDKTVSLESIKKVIAAKDYVDEHRVVGALKPATEAIVFDSTNYDLIASVKVLITIICANLNH